MIFRGGGGQFGVADAHRRGIVYHALAVLRVAAGNHEINVALRFAADHLDESLNAAKVKAGESITLTVT
ncbi:hypothetical protein GTA85_004650, partial [Salmonella enterica subsp. enterica serovar Enteritidis]|nr:hypothetical protein [Salmonella enterica subsp. enterica serovar Enteritidis]